MKKLIVLLLCVLMLLVPCVIAAADTDYVQPEETMPFVATEETDFLGGVLMVTIKKEYSFPNRTWALSAFGNPSHISSFVDITASENPDVINSYSSNENYRQIFEFYLDTSNKQIAIAVAETIHQSEYVHSVSVNRVYETAEESPTPQTDTSVQPRGAMTPANLFTNNYRKITADPLVSYQYSIFTTHTNRAWAITKGSSNIIVGVIDSGVDPIPDLANNLVEGYDLTGVTWENPTNIIQGNTQDDKVDNHGTKIASLIVAEHNTIGISGMAPNVKVMPLKVCDLTEVKNFAMVRAFSKAQEEQLPIVNLSIGVPKNLENEEGDPNSIDDEGVNYNWLAAMMNYSGLIVNSAGNNDMFMFPDHTDPPVCLDNLEHPIYPLTFKDQGLSNMIVVGSVDENNQWCVSNWSSHYVDLMAPGKNIFVSYLECWDNENNCFLEPSENYVTYIEDWGSSFSAPMVAAAAALLLSYDPTLTTAELKEIILDNVTYIPELATRCATSGVLNVYKALSSIMKENSKKLYDYCVSIEVTGEHVFSADPITISYPSEVVQLTDIYVYPEIKFAPYYSVYVVPQDGSITISFVDTLTALPVGTVAFELWFSAPEDTITNKFFMVNGGFEIDNENSGLRSHSFMLGDHGRTGNLNDMMSWFDFIISSGGISTPLDVNRDMIIDNADRVKAQEYLAGEIVSLFY